MAPRRLSPPDDGLDGHQPETPPGVTGSHASKYTKEDSNMKDTSFRTFTIPRADGHIPFKFAVHTLADGTVQVTRISPYDETAESLSPEQIAYFLIEADMKAHLEPRTCHN